MPTIRFRPFLLLTAVLLAAPAAVAQPLRVVEVAAPDIHCLFNASCTQIANDSTAPVPIAAATEGGRLQSRTSPPGQAGQPGAGLVSYQYRLDLTASRGITARICVRELTFPAGPTARLDYDGDGRPDDVFVITRGGLGSVGPTTAQRVGGDIRFRFQNAVCPGATSYFFGFAAAGAPLEQKAELGLTHGGTVASSVRTPGGRPTLPRPEDPPAVGQRVPGCVASGVPLERVPQWTNVCRCLSDATLREFRCALRHPGALFLWDTSWPIPGEPVRVDYTVVRLDPQQPLPEISIDIPGARRLTGADPVLAPGEDLASGHLWFLAPEQGPPDFEVRAKRPRP